MTMTGFQLEGLQRLGYTKRESEFLFLVATHSGYFTNRQFKCFAQTDSGSVSHAFIRKLLDQKHATYHAYRSGGRVYHLFARKVYQAIERENLRTRKKHELEYVKTRLVALDFVLAHPQYRYLETEAEKLTFFENEWNLSRDVFPVKQYRAKKSAEVTPRYFVDRFPMFVNDTSSPPVVTFTYVDSEAVTLEAFGTHLRAYSTLFQTLPKLGFIYLAPTPRLFRAAESEFQEILYAPSGQRNSMGLVEYFRIRKAWDQKERVASSDVVSMKEAQARYGARKFEELYEKWRQGTIGENGVVRTTETASPSVRSVFQTLLCGSSLTVFANPRSNGVENCAEKDTVGDVSQLSAIGSIETSGT
jgi:hypothetical protein